MLLKLDALLEISALKHPIYSTMFTHLETKTFNIIKPTSVCNKIEFTLYFCKYNGFTLLHSKQ